MWGATGKCVGFNSFFLLFINDMPNLSNSSHYTLFADDTTLTCGAPNYRELIHKTNTELSILHNWTIDNKLSLNAEKTSSLLFPNRLNDIESPLILSINGSTIYCESRVKFLGVYFDHKMNFSDHISYLCSKLSKTCLLYTSPSPRDKRQSRMPSSA